MGYMREKYTRGYFLKQDQNGNKVNIGAEGVEEFLADARPRFHDKEILDKINFNGKNVIDFGFGRGEAIKYICEHEAKRVTGVDFSASSLELASAMLDHYGHQPQLFCEDALRFVKDHKKKNSQIGYDIVIMFDFVEHVPRDELKQLFIELKNLLSDKAIIMINTPVYKVDNDVICEGLKEGARDSSDEWEQTQGMHCNRYTKKSLIKFMENLGYIHITAQFFSPNFKSILPNMRSRFLKAKKESFPLRGPFKKDLFEKVLTAGGVAKPIWKKVFSRSTISLIIPPVLSVAKGLIFKKKEIPPYRYKPAWHRIKGGILRGRWFFIDTHHGAWQEIIEGTFDKFFFDFLKKFDLRSKVIFDVGAFIGSHSLVFAELVGSSGKIYSFEPNQFNIKRMKKIFAKNRDLGRRISIAPFVLSNENGKVEFNFSNQIDSGYSSAGYVEGADTPSGEEVYRSSNFQKCHVESIKLDDLETKAKITQKPFLIKLDVEGAESEILSGGIKYLKRYKPIILVEIHSAYNMVRSLEVLFALGYKVEVLNQNRDGRAFLCAKPKGKKISHG